MSEASRFIPTTHSVHGALKDESAFLVEVTVDLAARAEIAPATSGDGATWQYGGESVTFLENSDAMPVTHHIAPANDAGSDFHVITGDGQKHPVEFSEDGEMGGEHVEAFRRVQVGIFAGSIVGSHELFVAKAYVSENDSDGEAVVQATVAQNSKGDGNEPSTAVDLHFVRSSPRVENPYGDSTVIQTYRVEYAPAADEIKVGHDLNVESYIEIEGTRDPATGNVEVTMHTDTDPQRTAGAMQQRYRPQTPMDEWPNGSTWQRLVAQPIGQNEIMQASAA
jgi:hypothetical protein